MEASRTPATRGTPICFTFEGNEIEACAGETVAAALLAAGIDAFGETREGSPRAPLCNMGTCFDCAVTVNGAPLVRACLTDAVQGLTVTKHVAS